METAIDGDGKEGREREQNPNTKKKWSSETIKKRCEREWYRNDTGSIEDAFHSMRVAGTGRGIKKRF